MKKLVNKLDRQHKFTRTVYISVVDKFYLVINYDGIASMKIIKLKSLKIFCQTFYVQVFPMFA